MILTMAEVGTLEWEKAHADRARFRGIPTMARGYARDRGTLAVAKLVALREALAADAISEVGRTHLATDAEMFARMAFKGWRAYRLMVDDETQ